MTEDDDDPLASAVDHKGPCPKCGSKDNLVTYRDGHSHCFSPGCGHHTSASGSEHKGRHHHVATEDTKHIDGLIDAERQQPIQTITRGLKSETLARYQYRQLLSFGKKKEMVHIWPIYDLAGHLANQRVRYLAEKDFAVLRGDGTPGVNDCQLFGRTVWGDANDKRVIITEGELDAMSVAQCSSFKYPVVSVNGGAASAAKCLKANYRWLDRFGEIVLWFDADAAGQAAVDECVKLFAVGKVKIAKVDGLKDANEALQAKKYAEIEQAVYAAVAWKPKGIVNAADLWADLEDEQETPCWFYPYPGLQKMLGGFRRAETIYWVAGTGIGKTTSLQEALVYAWGDNGHTETPAKIGYLGFEDRRKTVLKDFMSIIARQRIKINPLPEKEKHKVFNTLFGSRRFELFDVENAEWTFDAVESYIRYMAKVLDCNIIVLDPLSFLVAMFTGETNERVALDKVSQRLAALSKELNVHVSVSHHLTRPAEGPGHEEGGQVRLNQVRGSGGVANFAAAVIGFERNQQADNLLARTVTAMRVLKNRWLSTTGIACYTQYDLATGRTYEIPEAEAKALLNGKDIPQQFAEDDTGKAVEF